MYKSTTLFALSAAAVQAQAGIQTMFASTTSISACDNANCPPNTACLPNKDGQVECTPVQTLFGNDAVITSHSPVVCPTIAEIFCEFGNVVDPATGCPLGVCKTESVCNTFDCEDGYACLPDKDGTPFCVLMQSFFGNDAVITSHSPVVCPPIAEIFCEYGNVVNSATGCPLGVCKTETSVCNTFDCGPGYVCVPKVAPCFAQPCPVLPTCVATSGTRPVVNRCVAGALLDGQGGVEVDASAIPYANIGSGCTLSNGAQLVVKASREIYYEHGGIALTPSVARQTIASASGPAVQLRLIPQYSCKVQGCSRNTWDTKQDGSSSCLLDFELGSANKQCYCDDACTQFKDCCQDYQATCLSGATQGTLQTFQGIAVGEPNPSAPQGIAVGEPNGPAPQGIAIGELNPSAPM